MDFDYLKSFRKQIDRIDEELLFLIKRRFNLVKKIVKYKIDNEISIEDTSREEEVFKNVLNQAGMMDLRNEFVRDFFKILIEESKKEQLEIIEKKTKTKKK
ncbi:MAG: chorismate mutase [Nanoarchaeota archaeon]